MRRATELIWRSYLNKPQIFAYKFAKWVGFNNSGYLLQKDDSLFLSERWLLHSTKSLAMSLGPNSLSASPADTWPLITTADINLWIAVGDNMRIMDQTRV